ncbi:hypothetical protein Rhopal_001831-T1 [Rhodotorula paludigena]|uniref:Uncharacterized protein n=1 Tax=Rhodotorula paludigena TaxID=86838 RepID=A0AAV5GH48_9BASI|nr:hypothetical protein Rhopal_001831-T1 [Rhodotorula paludigena]
MAYRSAATSSSGSGATPVNSPLSVASGADHLGASSAWPLDHPTPEPVPLLASRFAPAAWLPGQTADRSVLEGGFYVPLDKDPSVTFARPDVCARLAKPQRSHAVIKSHGYLLAILVASSRPPINSGGRKFLELQLAQYNSHARSGSTSGAIHLRVLVPVAGDDPPAMKSGWYIAVPLAKGQWFDGPTEGCQLSIAVSTEPIFCWSLKQGPTRDEVLVTHTYLPWSGRVAPDVSQVAPQITPARPRAELAPPRAFARPTAAAGRHPATQETPTAAAGNARMLIDGTSSPPDVSLSQASLQALQLDPGASSRPMKPLPRAASLASTTSAASTGSASAPAEPLRHVWRVSARVSQDGFLDVDESGAHSPGAVLPSTGPTSWAPIHGADAAMHNSSSKEHFNLCARVRKSDQDPSFPQKAEYYVRPHFAETSNGQYRDFLVKKDFGQGKEALVEAEADELALFLDCTWEQGSSNRKWLRVNAKLPTLVVHHERDSFAPEVRFTSVSLGDSLSHFEFLFAPLYEDIRRLYGQDSSGAQ